MLIIYFIYIMMSKIVSFADFSVLDFFGRHFYFIISIFCFHICNLIFFVVTIGFYILIRSLDAEDNKRFGGLRAETELDVVLKTLHSIVRQSGMLSDAYI